MCQPAIENVRGRDSTADRMQTTLKFRNHATTDHAIARELRDRRRRKCWDQRLWVGRVAQDASDIGEKQNLFGLERHCECTGRSISVDVIALACRIGAERCHHGHHAVVEQTLHGHRVHRHDVADETERWVTLHALKETHIVA